MSARSAKKLGLTSDCPVPADLLQKYAHLRNRPRGDPITQEHKDALCDIVARHHLTKVRACRIVGLSPTTLNRLTGGDDPKDPEWAEMLETANALSELYWLKKIEQYSDEKNTAGAKACEFMLRALNRKRYTEDSRTRQEKVQVNIIQGSPGSVRLPEVKVELTEPLSLPEVDA